MVTDAVFEGNKSFESDKIKFDYDGIMLFGVTLKNRPNGNTFCPFTISRNFRSLFLCILLNSYSDGFQICKLPDHCQYRAFEE